LRHKPDLLAVPTDFQVLDVSPVQEHGASRGVVEALDQLHGSRLAAPGRTDESNGFSCWYGKVHSCVHLVVGAHRVGEPHVPKLQGALHVVQGSSLRFVERRNRGLLVPQGLNPRCRHIALHLIHCIRTKRPESNRAKHDTEDDGHDLGKCNLSTLEEDRGDVVRKACRGEHGKLAEALAQSRYGAFFDEVL